MNNSLWSYPAADVWAAACAAHRTNGAYIKTGTDTEPPNKALLWNFLTTNEGVTDDDRAMAEQVRLHCQAKIMSILGGSTNPFDKKVAEIAQQETFSHRMDLAFISFLPSMYLRDIKRHELDFSTRPVGQVGEKLSLTLTIDAQGYSEKYNTYWHTAREGTNRFFFFSSHVFPEGETVEVTAKVRAHRNDGTTQLNYVKRSTK